MVRNNEEMNKQLSSVTIAQGGVLPDIHEKLVVQLNQLSPEDIQLVLQNVHAVTAVKLEGSDEIVDVTPLPEGH